MEQLVIYLLMVQKIINLKTKYSEIVAISLFLGKISKDWSGLNGYIYDFIVDYDAISVDDTLDIHFIKLFNEKEWHDIKMFGINKKEFVVAMSFFSGIDSAAMH